MLNQPDLRFQTIAAGTSFVIDAWTMFSTKCNTGATVTVTNRLGDSITDDGSMSLQNEYPGGMSKLTFTATGGTVILMYIGNRGLETTDNTIGDEGFQGIVDENNLGIIAND